MAKSSPTTIQKVFIWYHRGLLGLLILVLVGFGLFQLVCACLQTQFFNAIDHDNTFIMAGSIDVVKGDVRITNAFTGFGDANELLKFYVISGGLSLAFAAWLLIRRFSLKFLCISVFALACLFAVPALLPATGPSQYVMSISDSNEELSIRDVDWITRQLTSEFAWDTLPHAVSETLKAAPKRPTVLIDRAMDMDFEDPLNGGSLYVKFDSETDPKVRGLLLEFYADCTARLMAEIISKRTGAVSKFSADRYHTEWSKYRDEWLAKVKSDSK